MKGAIKGSNCHCPVHYRFQTSHVPILYLLKCYLLRNITNLVLNGGIFWVVLGSCNNRKPSRTSTPCHCLMNICCMMSSQVVPHQDSMIISTIVSVCFDIRADMVTEITEDVCCCPYRAYTPNPSSRILDAASNMWSKICVPGFNCKQDSDLWSMVVVTIFTYTKHFECPPPGSIAFLQSDAEFININQFETSFPTYGKREGAVTKTPETNRGSSPTSRQNYSRNR